MSMDIKLTPQEIVTLKRIIKVQDDAEAVAKAVREFLRLVHLGELKTVSGKVEFEANWQDLEALELRGINVSDYVRQVTVTQARKEVVVAHEQTISMTPEEQLTFWKALSAPPELTDQQEKLGKVMRDES